METLQNYYETYNDMRDTAQYFLEESDKFNNSDLKSAAERAIELCNEGNTITDLDEAEAHYNEIAGELFECNEIYDELNEN